MDSDTYSRIVPLTTRPRADGDHDRTTAYHSFDAPAAAAPSPVAEVLRLPTVSLDRQELIALEQVTIRDIANLTFMITSPAVSPENRDLARSNREQAERLLARINRLLSVRPARP